MTLTLTYKADTRNYTVYDVEPENSVLKNVIYLNTRNLKTAFDGRTPLTLTLTVAEK